MVAPLCRLHAVEEALPHADFRLVLLPVLAAPPALSASAATLRQLKSSLHCRT